jgi:ankyrin repeat protein
METREPIRGAVVLVVWGETPSVPGYLMIKIHDTDSVLTDESGRFHIPGKRIDDLQKNARLASGAIIFKAGYGFVQIQELETLAHMARDRQARSQEDGPASSYWDVRLKRGKPVLLLRKLNVRQMERDRPELLPSIPWSERKLLLWEITREKRAVKLGVTPDQLTEPDWSDPKWKELEALLDKLETGFSEEVFLQRVQAGDLRATELFLAAGIHKNFANSDRRTALVIAVSRGNAEMTNLLLRWDADVTVQDTSGRTALDHAANVGRVDLVEPLLAHGAKIRHSRFPKYGALWIASKQGHTPIVRLLLDQAEVEEAVGVSALLIAAESGHRPVTETLLDYGIPINSVGDDRRTALMIAASKGNTDMVGFLLKRGADTEISDSVGQTVLLVESRAGREAMVKVLLEGGAKVTARLRDGDGCLSAAAKGGHVQVVRLLLKHGADVRSDPSALVHAASGGHLDIAQIFLDRGLTAGSDTGTRALGAAAEGGHRQVIELLVKRGANVNAKAPGDWPSLVRAAMGGRLDIVRLLVDRGALVRSEGGDQALVASAGRGHTDIVRFLLDRGANVESTAGAPALSNAAEFGHLETVRLILAQRPRMSPRLKTWALNEAATKGHRDIVQLLVENGAAANGGQGSAQHPLFAAMKNIASEPFKKTFVENGVQQNRILQPIRGGLVAVPFGDSPRPTVGDARPVPVERAAEVARILLDRGADVNAKDGAGKTVLILSSEHGVPSLTKLFLERGADPGVRDNGNRTAMAVAKERGRDDIVALLKDAGVTD